jgi:membrane-bound serine protease (ClpP class)
VEIFVIPGFGIAGIAGILCIIAGVLGMLLRSDVGPIPWPRDAMDWQGLKQGLQGLLIGLIGFIALAALLTRYIPQISFLSGLMLVPKTVAGDLSDQEAFPVNGTRLDRGDIGVVVTQLHPTGRVRFGDELQDCVTQGELVEPGMRVEIVSIHGNRIVVRPMEHTP